MFTTPTGHPVRRQQAGALWRAAAHHVGIEGRSGWHDLRHYFASKLIAAGLSVKVIQTRLGHKSAMVTLNVYGHMFRDSDDQTRAAVDLALAEIASGAEFLRSAESTDTP